MQMSMSYSRITENHLSVVTNRLWDTQSILLGCRYSWFQLSHVLPPNAYCFGEGVVFFPDCASLVDVSVTSGPGILCYALTSGLPSINFRSVGVLSRLHVLASGYLEWGEYVIQKSIHVCWWVRAARASTQTRWCNSRVIVRSRAQLPYDGFTSKPAFVKCEA